MTLFSFILLLSGLLTFFPALTCFPLHARIQGGTPPTRALTNPSKKYAGEGSSGTGGRDANPTDIGSSAPPIIAGVVAPLEYRGPYPCLGLKFPHLDDSSVFNFILDTGANVNGINADLARKLNLPRLERIPKPLATAGMGGMFVPGDLHLVGNCSLAGLPPEQSHVIFMRNLTAASLPNGGPPVEAAGLLGSMFVSSFAGVEFDWYGTDGDPPTFIFYFGDELPQEATTGMVRVPLTEFLQLFTVTIQIDGVNLPALLDTGSPFTILSESAAQRAGVSVVKDTTEGGRSDNKVDVSHGAKQSIGHKSLYVGGVDGRPMKIIRSQSTTHQINVGSCSLGQRPVYVGNVPALAVLESAADGARKQQQENEAPVAILGLDSLRGAYRMILSTRTRTSSSSCEMWLEELDNTKPLYKSQ